MFFIDLRLICYRIICLIPQYYLVQGHTIRYQLMTLDIICSTRANLISKKYLDIVAFRAK